MSAATPVARRIAGLGQRLSAGWPGRRGTVAVLVALVAASAFLRTRALDAAYWIDEAISIGIASFDLTEIPGELRKDGSPPLYYLLLHVWMRAFGDGESATHALSVVIALLSIPAAFWAGRTVFGTRTGWVAALLATVNPYLTFYAQETRMYALVAVLGLVVAASFLRVFAGRDRRVLPVFVAALVAMLYTHNWAIFLGAGTVAALGLLWRWAPAAERRALLRDAAIGYGAVALLYLPWVPTLLFQAQNTGAPWATRPRPKQLLEALALLVGGYTTGIVLLLIGGMGVAALVRRDGGGQLSDRGRRAAALLTIFATASVVAWLASQVSPAFASRYFAAVAGPLLLLAAAGLAHAGRLGLVCLAIVLVLWADPRTRQLNGKSNARQVGAMLQTMVTPGDLVVSTHPEQLPVVAHYFPKGLRYGTSLGIEADRRLFDWRDAVARLRATKARPTARALVSTLKVGQDLVLVQPILRTYRWKAPWTALVRKRSFQWERALDGDRRLRRDAVVPVFGYDPVPRGVRTVIYKRVR
jgi:hypothetical protein